MLKLINGFNYSINEQGQVFSHFKKLDFSGKCIIDFNYLKPIKSRICKEKGRTQPRLSVVLYKYLEDGTRKKFKKHIHRLLAELFHT